MRTIIIVGTDWTGPNPAWIRQPFLDGGRLTFHRDSEADWTNLFHELGHLGRVSSCAIGIRGAYNATDATWRAPAKAAYLSTSAPRPTLCPWFDTVGLPDMVNPPNTGGVKFDFANAAHIDIAIQKYVRVFFDTFAECPLEMTASGRLLIPWWGIATETGHGFTNQSYAQRLLGAVDAYLKTLGFTGADHVVDRTWLEYAPHLDVFGVHDWFNPWNTPPESCSIRTHNGVTVGCVVPGFCDPNHPLPERIPADHGETARIGLAACRLALCDVVLLEGATDFVEGAEWMRDAAGNTAKLDALRTHMELTTPAQPIDPAPMPGGRMQMAVTADPILKWKTGVLVVSPLAADRYAMRWTQPDGEAGYPDANSRKYLCLNPDGTTEAKDTIGEWESSQPVKGDDYEISWFTINAGQDQSATLVFGLKQFALA